MNKFYAILCLAGSLLGTRAQGQSCNAAFVDSVHGANVWVSATQTSLTAYSYYDFGDGGSAFGYSTTHTYTTPGTYTIRHYIEDSINQCSDTATESVTLQFTTCAVTFQPFLPDSSKVPVTATFVAQPSPGDPAGAKTYSWTVNDSVASTLDSFSYTFNQPGLYSVTVTMTADSGCVASYNQTVYIPNPDSCTLTAGFTGTQDSTNPLLYHFYAATVDGNYQYLWNFGDGSSGTGIATSHQYAQKGIYNVILTLMGWTGQDSCTAQTNSNEYVDTTAGNNCYIVVRDSVIGDHGTEYGFLAQPSDTLLSQTWTIFMMPDSNDMATLHTDNPNYEFPDSGTYQIICTGMTTSGCSAIGYAWVSIQGDSVVNRDDAISVPALTSYPDPVRDQATIDVKLPSGANISLTVYNAQGQPVGHIETSGVSGDNQISIPTTALSNGMYFVRITSGNLQMQSRFQKQQ